jgi:4-aminobutyrate aminotransferase-like enzyme
MLMSDVLARESRHLIRGHQQIWEKSGLVIERGEGATLWDDRGRSYLDLWAGGGVCSIGHGHPEFTEIVYRQLQKLVVGSHPSAARAAYVSELATVVPPPLSSIQLYTSGAEAVEAALRLARSFTGRSAFLSFEGSFHGKTLGALSLGDWSERQAFGPLAPGFVIAPYPVAGPPMHTRERGVRECLAAAERIMEEAGGQFAGIVVEPVQGTAGNLFPPIDFLRGLRLLADRTGALLIFDEIITGFGRTGRLFRSGVGDVIPDLLIVGKGMGNGVPVSGMVTTAEIGRALPFAGPSGSSSSYGGNPLSAAAAGATLRALRGESLVENARRVGTLLCERLAARLKDHPIVRGPWGEGLLIGLELVDPRSGRRLARAECERIFRALLERGLLVAAYTPMVRMNPPLCLTDGEAEFAAETIADVLTSWSVRHDASW